MTYVLIVMFYTTFNGPTTYPFVAMQSFSTEEGCKAAMTWVKGTNPMAKAECIKDGKTP